MLFGLSGILNRLLPFATPGTPVLQDLVHLAVLCGLLYFAPQLQELYRGHARRAERDPVPNDASTHLNEAATTVNAPTPVPDELVDAELIAHNDEQDHDPHGMPERVIGTDNDQPIGAVEGPAAGPADGPAITPQNRHIGAKKAKSLARRDQRRAYNEFMRSQGEAQRAREAEGKQEREAAAAEERRRRAEIEEELREKARAEREDRRNREVQEREEELRRREMATSIVRDSLLDRGYVSLDEVAGKVGRHAAWAVSLVRASGLLTDSRGEEIVFITETKFVVKVRKSDLEQALRDLEGTQCTDGGADVTSYTEIGRVLEGILMGA